MVGDALPASTRKVLSLTETKMDYFSRPIISLSKKTPKRQTGNSHTKVASGYSFLNIYLYIYGCLSTCKSAPHACLVSLRVQKRRSDPLGLEL